MEISIIENSDQEKPLEKGKRWLYLLKRNLLPSKKRVNRCITQIVGIFLLFSAIYGICSKKFLHEMFALFLLTTASFAFGKILPSQIGMLIAGFLFQNTDLVYYYQHISKETISTLRGIGFCFILLRCGLMGDSIVKKSFHAWLTILPCLTEVATAALFSHYLLHLSWICSFCLGFAAATVSFENERILPMASLDNILTVMGFTVCYSILFSSSQGGWTIVKGPLEPLVGLAFGAVFGIVLWYFPTQQTTSKGMLLYYNMLFLSLGCVAAMFLSRHFNIPGAGPAASLSLAFVASKKWPKDHQESIHSITRVLCLLLEPFLFSSIGAEVKLEHFGNHAGYGVLIVVCGCLSKFIVSVAVISSSGENVKEKFLICISWLSKTSLQVAVGCQVLDFSRRNEDESALICGTAILYISVLSILLTAPLSIFGRCFHQQDKKEDQSTCIKTVYK